MITKENEQFILKSLVENGYNNLVDKDLKNHQFLTYIKEKGYIKSNLNETSLPKFWTECHSEQLNNESIRKKLKYFNAEKHFFSIIFVEKIPPINLYKNAILILEKEQDNTLKHWKSFQETFLNSSVKNYNHEENDFNLNQINSYQEILKLINEKDESNKKSAREKSLYILFFLYLVSKDISLLPVLFIFSKDSFFIHTTNQKRLGFFQENHFFIKNIDDNHLIKDELDTDHKSKYTNYMRFSFLVNSNNSLVTKIKDIDIARIFNHLDKSTKSSTMLANIESFIRKILYWHGAYEMSLTKATAGKEIFSPLEILSQYKTKTKNEIILNAFMYYFNHQKNNAVQRKLTKHIVNIIKYIDTKYGTITTDELRIFFTVEFDGNEYKSLFIHYLKDNDLAKTIQKELQLIIFESFGNHNELNTCFPKQNLIKLYKSPKKRHITRLAFDKKILDTMKYICLIDPPRDRYYVQTNFKNTIKSWDHIDKMEPQLPVMLFLNLSMPWRSEHIISLDRENFLSKNEDNKIIGLQITTDKNQKNDFYIEREFFDDILSFEYNGKKINVLELINDTIDHAKKTFPNLQSLLRNENENWGYIKPILCRKEATGFIVRDIYVGYYYKVLLKALFHLDYDLEKIQYFVTLSKSGENKLKFFPSSFDLIEPLTCSEIFKCFNSTYFSPHSLRKSNITHLILNKKSLEYILKLSGHAALSTVLGVYIDYDMIARFHISEKTQTTIRNNFRLDSSTRDYSRKIISIIKNLHTLKREDIQQTLNKYDLISSVLIININNMNLTKNDNKEDLLEPMYWEDLSTGICTAAFNCPTNIHKRCSICPHFLTSPKFISDINSKIMQLTTKVVTHYKIINKHTFEEHLNNHEAIIYEEETTLELAELQGYFAIVDEFNKSIYSLIQNTGSESDKKNLPAIIELSIIKPVHIPILTAQLDIYKTARNNMDTNKEIDFATSEIYKKIMELIITEEIPKELFIKNISNREEVIELFLKNFETKNHPLDKTINELLLE